MPLDSKPDLPLEIGHVLFVDIVGYSKLLINEQSELLEHLKTMVRSTEQVRAADAEGKLIRLATGDGMALVFRTNPEAPAHCALELARADLQHPELKLRMGIHSGPINQITDLNDRINVTGAGINMAQRVMDCGDAGHILLSQHVADDLEQYPRWRPLLHELGECEVKHGLRLRLVNLYSDGVGNPELPEKFRKAGAPAAEPPRRKSSIPLVGISLLIFLLIGLAITALIFAPALLKSRRPTPPPSSSAPPPTSTPAIPEKSIAVLPFENLSDETQNAYFANGVQDEILTDLAKIADLKVISRTSVMQYKSGPHRNLREIGQQLGVAHLLEGSVQRAAGRIRVNAQLIDARTDAHLWAQTYDRDLADIFAIQSEVAKAIADQLQAKIAPAEKQLIEKQPTKDIAAYDFYVRGTEAIDRALFSDRVKDILLQAVDFLNEAIARDPSFLRAYCKLAHAHDQLYLLGDDHTAARLSLAEKAVHDALRLGPEAPEAHLALARHLYSKLNYEGARAEIELARRALPNEPQIFEWSGYIDRRQGRWPESTRNLERALELDPNNVVVLQQISLNYESLHNYQKAIAALRRVLSLRPNDTDTRLSLGQVDVFWKANPKPLHEVIESILRDQPQAAASIATTRVFLALAERDVEGGARAVADLGGASFGPNAINFPAAYEAGVFAQLKGDTAAAQASFLRARATQQNIVDAQPEYGPALSVLAQIDAVLGQKEDALREGRRAAELMPPSKDSINGTHIMTRLAATYAAVGEKDLALAQLARALELPVAPHYGILKLFPDWDPLRGDPRFDEIVASLAPKE